MNASEKKNPQVNGYIRKNKAWATVLEALRAIALDSPLVEEVKWRIPCYTFEGNNVLLITALKACCTVGFVKGALLKDPKGILQKPGENTQSARVIRVASEVEVKKLAPVLKAYIREAIAVEKAGLKVAFKPITAFAVPDELQQLFDKDPELSEAFKALTPGRQRLYLMHIAAPKQAKTRVARAEKCIPLILAGKGLQDDYMQKVTTRKQRPKA